MINKSDAQKNGIATKDGDSRMAADRGALRQKIQEVLPSLINSDGQLDIKSVRDAIAIANSSSNDQGYELTFAGKGFARAQASTPTGYELKAELQQSKNFDETKNVVIRGDNLDVLKILYQNYFKKIKMIYIDPPYNTKSENFIYKDNFKVSDEQLIDKLDMNPETVDFLQNVYGTRSHSGWLSFMYPRLKLARDLLSDDGLILVQIDDNESHSLKLIMDELFGENNFKEEIIWEYRTGGMPRNENCFGKKHDTIFAYSKKSTAYKFDNQTIKEKIHYEKDFFGCKKDEHGQFYVEVNIRDVIGGEFEILQDKKLKKVSIKPLINMSKERIPGFDSQKPSSLIVFLSRFYLRKSKSDVILDFFAGSGTTGDAVMQLNAEDGGDRKFVLVQWDEKIEKEEAHKYCTDKGLEPVISSICIERLNTSGEKLKADIAKHNKTAPGDGKKTMLDIGYKVYSTTQKPTVINKGEGEIVKLELDNQRGTVLDTLTNMLCVTGKTLDTAIECLIDKVLYKADDEIYLLGAIKAKELEQYKGKKINLNGWSDINLHDLLEAGLYANEEITVIY